MPFVSPIAVAPLDGRITAGAADSSRAGGTGRARPRDVDLVDGVERVGGVAGEHVGESGRKTATRRQEDARAPRRLVELEQRVDRRGVVDGRREGDTGCKGALRPRGDESARQGDGDRVPTPSSRTVATGSAEVGTVELAPTAAGGRHAALPT